VITDDRTDRSGARRVAFAAVFWTAGIASLKLVIGLLTGSVAVIGDALHSVLDVVAALLTFGAVRLAAKPPDENHPFGHGRAENLAALGEAMIMFVVGAGVAVQAIHKLLSHEPVRAPVYALAAMALATVVAAWRAMTLRRAAKRFASPALEADATNITADIFESLAVIGGLGAARLGFHAGDPIAALVVVGTMWLMSGRIGLSAIHVLMDRVPEDLTQRLTEACAGVSGVIDVGDLRVRQSGADVHAEVTVSVGRTTSVEQSHDITEAVEAAVAGAVPGATATVHVEPSTRGEDIVARTFAAANRIGMTDQVHNVLPITHPEGTWLMLHAKVPPWTTLRDADAITDQLEAELHREIAGLARIEIHLEPHELRALHGKVVVREDLADGARRLAEGHPPITRCHEVVVSEANDGIHLVLHCEAPPDTSIAAVHDASLGAEQDIHGVFPEVKTVTIHFEPERLP
jgi:cation diffusion facilitator family transporter